MLENFRKSIHLSLMSGILSSVLWGCGTNSSNMGLTTSQIIFTAEAKVQSPETQPTATESNTQNLKLVTGDTKEIGNDTTCNEISNPQLHKRSNYSKQS